MHHLYARVAHAHTECSLHPERELRCPDPDRVFLDLNPVVAPVVIA